MFVCCSTCFGRLHTHHQELTTALTASGFTLELGGSIWLVNLFELYDDARTCQRQKGIKLFVLVALKEH
jgi:hypothetical protein